MWGKKYILTQPGTANQMHLTKSRNFGSSHPRVLTLTLRSKDISL